jgi:hypothetical protein
MNDILYQEELENGDRVVVDDRFRFEFDFDIDGIKTVEQRIDDRMKDVIVEELEQFCFNCQTDMMWNSDSEEFYCPVCNDRI